jgi:hypothetical protein
MSGNESNSGYYVAFFANTEENKLRNRNMGIIIAKVKSGRNIEMSG